MIKRILAFLTAILLVAGAAYASVSVARESLAVKSPSHKVRSAAAGEFYTSARGMCTVEMNTGRVLFEHNSEAELPMASTTKIVTAITFLDNCSDLDTAFEIDPRSVGIEGTSVYLQKGERKTARELLYGLMLRSGNDTAMALALRLCPDQNAFAEMMNATAKRAGATNSAFKNPHGLDAEGHYTTARDLALISAYAMKNPTFAEIVATKEKRISGVEYDRVIRNKNRLLHGMADCVGVKTGFTKRAGRCFVGAVTRNGMTVVCAVLNCGPMFEESAELMDLAHEQFTLKQIIEQGQFIPVESPRPVGIARESFLYPLRPNESVEIECDRDLVIVELGDEIIYRAQFNALN
jgi:D-alanyl-D-alanine carboxypeptidase (penicillin-binding protein 5/6)